MWITKAYTRVKSINPFFLLTSNLAWKIDKRSEEITVRVPKRQIPVRLVHTIKIVSFWEDEARELLNKSLGLLFTHVLQPIQNASRGPFGVRVSLVFADAYGTERSILWLSLFSAGLNFCQSVGQSLLLRVALFQPSLFGGSE